MDRRSLAVLVEIAERIAQRRLDAARERGTIKTLEQNPFKPTEKIA